MGINKENRHSLEKFIQNIYWAKELTIQESTKNLEESLVEIFYKNGGHQSNGLLITENGYFLTNYHCVESHSIFNPLFIKNSKNEIYKISRIYEKNEKEDIVLVKANIPKKPITKKYKIFNLKKLKKSYSLDFPICLKTIRKNEIHNTRRRRRTNCKRF